MNDVKIIFRDSLRGFNKEDVNNYIEKLNQDMLWSKAISSKEILEKDNELKKLQDDLVQADAEGKQKEIDRLNDELKKAQIVIMAQNEQTAKSEDENNGLKEKLASYEKKLALLEEKLKNTNSELEGRKNDGELSEKAKKYDAMAEKLGSVLLEAEKNAGIYRDKAATKVDEQLEQIKKQISDFSSSAADDYNSILTGARDELVEIMSKLQNRLNDENKKKDESFIHFRDEMISKIAEKPGEENADKN